MKKRFVLGMFLIPVLFVLSAYISWPLWAPAVARSVLADQDINLQQVDIARPGWQSLDIANVVLSYQAADYVATLSSPKIELTYSWLQLFQGQLAILRMPVVRVQLAEVVQEKQISIEPLSLPLVFPSTLFAQLPLSQLDIDSLQLLLPEGAVYQSLTGSLHYNSEQLELQLADSTLSNAELPDLVLDLKADRKNRLQLNLRQGLEELLVIHSQIDNGAEQLPPQLQGDLSLDLQASSELLKQLGLLDTAYQLSGKTLLHWQASLPRIIDKNSWQQQTLTGKFSSQGSFVSPHNLKTNVSAAQAQFDIKVDFQVKDAALLVSFTEFNVEGDIDLSSELAPWLTSEMVKALPVQITLAPETQLSVDFSPVAIGMEKGTFELKLGGSNAPLSAKLQLKSLHLQAEKEWRVEAGFNTQLAFEQVEHPQVSAADLIFYGAGQVNLSAENTRLQMEAGSSLQGSRVKVQDGQIDNLNIKIPRAFEVVLQEQKLTVPELELQFGGSQLGWQGQTGQFAAASLQVKDLLLDLDKPLHVIAHIDSLVTGIQAATGDLQLKPLEFNGRFELSGGALFGTLALTDAAGVVTIDGTLKHQLDSGRGTLDSQLQRLVFRQRDTYFPRLFTNWAYPFDLFAGQVDMNFTLSWDISQEEVAGGLQGRVQLNNVGGFYDSNLFHGLNTELTVDAPLADLKVIAKQFEIDSLDAGIPVENITFSLQSTLDKLQVNDFQAELLGGRVSQKSVTYDLNRNENELLLQLHNIQLSEVLALESGIEGRGILDGQLPIKVTTDGITMKLGRVQARSPGGIIKYQGAQAMSSAASNVGVGFALDALYNFHYEVLDIKIDYAEDGQLQLKTTLLGRNPDLPEQRPVRFNINIQENIPALIKSLKLSQDIGDDIERRLKVLMNKKQEINP